MNVRDLRELLLKYDPETEVVLWLDLSRPKDVSPLAVVTRTTGTNPVILLRGEAWACEGMLGKVRCEKHKNHEGWHSSDGGSYSWPQEEGK